MAKKESSENLIDKLLVKLSNKENDHLEKSVLLNVINISSYIVLSGFNDEIVNMIEANKPYDAITNKIILQVNHPENFIKKYIDFIASDDFYEIFYNYINDNQYVSFEIDLTHIEAKLKKNQIDESVFVEYMINNVVVPKINELAVKYKLLHDNNIVKDVIEQYVENFISMKINKSLDNTMMEEDV